MPLPRYDITGVWILRRTPTGCEHLQMRRAEGSYMGGIWSLCRGGIEAGETAVVAAIRELREETGLHPLELYRMGTLEQFYASDGDLIWHVPFFMAVVGADAEVALNDEHDAFRWVSDSEAEAALVWPSEFELLAEVRRFYLANHPTLALMRLHVASGT